MSDQNGEMKEHVVKIEPPDSSSLDSITVKTEPACIDDVYSLEEETIVKVEIDIEPTVIQTPDFVYMPQPCKQEPVEGSSAGHMGQPRMLNRTPPYTGALSTKKQQPLSCSSRTYKFTHAAAQNVSKLEGPQKCNICKKTFALKENYISHMNTHITEITPSGNSCHVEAQDNCPSDKSYSTVSDKAVARTASEDNSNSQSQRQDTGKSEINQMINIVEKSYTCVICNMCYTQCDSLIKHMKIHTNIDKFECDICNKHFKTKSSLKQHMISHTSEYLYHCEVCPKRFKTNGHLKQHTRIHTGERPYHCKVCNKRFRSSGNLNQHFITHTSERPYNCKICKKRFKSNDVLKQHTRIHKRKLPYHGNV